MAVIGCQWMRSRYQLAWLAFFGFLNVYMLRVNLSVALVAMVDTQEEDNYTSLECPVVGNDTSSPTSKHGAETFDWDKPTQGLILGSFFYGYLITQIPGGWLAGKYGGKNLFGFGILCTAVLTLITPLTAKSVPTLVITRILEGLGEGVTFPAIQGMWAVWAPPMERSKLAMISFSGAQMGTVIGLPLSGLITAQLGWPYVFYIFGAIAIVWFVVWMLLTSNTPDSLKFIDPEEREYINFEIATVSSAEPITLKNTPWLEMAKSPVLWATSCAHFCHNWGFYTLLTCLPTYMKDVLQFDIAKDSLLSSLPYVFMWVMIIVTSVVVDTMRARSILSTTAARKLVNAIGFLVNAACLLGIGYVGCNFTLAVVLLCIAGAFDGISQIGYNVNHLDIAPKYAGTLMGITNTIATIPGFLGPQVVGWLTTQHSTSEQWRSVFIISAEIYVFGIIIYSLLGSGEVQKWASVSGGEYEPLSTSDSSFAQDETSVNTAVSDHSTD
ncbi:sialin-like [Watersipora subatra]|uniref:sialin-like n=1 Tax=Watersipora subatra TaxID=2589382 RepID=UPI00355B7888